MRFHHRLALVIPSFCIHAVMKKIGGTIYCNIFDADIIKNFDDFSQLAQISKPKERIKREYRR